MTNATHQHPSQLLDYLLPKVNATVSARESASSLHPGELQLLGLALFHPPMLPFMDNTGGLPMDYLHPSVLLPDDMESSFRLSIQNGQGLASSSITNTLCYELVNLSLSYDSNLCINHQA